MRWITGGIQIAGFGGWIIAGFLVWGDIREDMVQDIKGGLPCRMSRLSGVQDNVRG